MSQDANSKPLSVREIYERPAEQILDNVDIDDDPM